MTEHYKGQRIADLLAEIEKLKDVLDNAPPEIMDTETMTKFAEGYANLAVAKAKLTALKGE